jgi:hypothetical protein
MLFRVMDFFLLQYNGKPCLLKLKNFVLRDLGWNPRRLRPHPLGPTPVV